MRHWLIGALLRTGMLLLLLSACSVGQQSARTEPQTMVTPQTKQVSAKSAGNTTADEVPTYTYEVVNSWPHLTTHFTQGLVYYDGHLYESTGQYGSSLLCRLDLKTGKVEKKVDVEREYFAEGMTILGDKIYQLTWQAHKGFVYDLKKFDRLAEFGYEGEGWGLTNDTHSLILSDGTNKIRFLDPQSFRVLRSIEVYDHEQPLMELNELEYIKGEIYANIWHSDKVVRIDPASGKILAWIDLAGLRRPEDGGNEDNVLNGIAYDEKNDRLFVTGKRWSKLYEIRLVKKFKIKS
ncbi:MAG: glutaminyl-peptide cyclotransferase [Acidobacteriota bacterium]|jgi:glutamine cyclotransferase|nr:glutaminyl-peptide cyclotransferase [Acidobacteriota bacterium]